MRDTETKFANQIEELVGEHKPRVLREHTKKLVKKWKRTGLLEGLKDSGRDNMAILLENQATHLYEASRTGGSSKEGWSGVVFPLVRKVFANLIAQELVSVQPMTIPSGLVFWLDFKYGTSVPAQDPRLYTAGDSLYGNSSASTLAGGQYGGQYQSYTQNYISASAVTTTVATASWANLQFDPDLSSSVQSNANAFKKLTIAASALTGVDVEAAKAIVVSGSDVDSNLNQHNYYDDANSNLVLFVSASDSYADTSSDLVRYVKVTSETGRGDFESGASGVGDIPEINIEIRSEAVVAATRRLKAIWTPEIAQDLNAYHSVDAEAELTTVLSEQISLDIDREIINMLLDNAVETRFWSKVISRYVSDSDGSVTSNGGTFYGTQNEWYQTLIEKILDVSNQIHKRTLRGAANFIVTSPDVATILEATHVFKPETIGVGLGDSPTPSYNLGVEMIGTLSNRWKVYKDPYFPKNEILVGFKGTSFIEAGAVYAPYVPLILTPTIFHPDDFTPRKGIMTRYAKKMVRPEFYGKVIVRDM